MNSQPQDTPALPEFAKDLVGIYLIDNEKDTLTITANSFEYGNSTSLLGHVKGSLSSGEAVLKIIGGYYILSMKDENIWQVIAFKKKVDEIDIYIINVEHSKEGVVSKLKKILPVKEIKDKEGQLDYYLIDPNKSEFEKLIAKKIFSKSGVFKRIVL